MAQVLSVELCQFLPGSFSSFFFQVKKNLEKKSSNWLSSFSCIATLCLQLAKTTAKIG